MYLINLTMQDQECRCRWRRFS